MSAKAKHKIPLKKGGNEFLKRIVFDFILVGVLGAVFAAVFSNYLATQKLRVELEKFKKSLDELHQNIDEKKYPGSFCEKTLELTTKERIYDGYKVADKEQAISLDRFYQCESHIEASNKKIEILAERYSVFEKSKTLTNTNMVLLSFDQFDDFDLSRSNKTFIALQNRLILLKNETFELKKIIEQLKFYLEDFKHGSTSDINSKILMYYSRLSNFSFELNPGSLIGSDQVVLDNAKQVINFIIGNSEIDNKQIISKKNKNQPELNDLCIISTGCNVFKSPNANSEIICSLKKFDTVNLIKEYLGWLHVSTDQFDGFIPSTSSYKTDFLFDSLDRDDITIAVTSANFLFKAKSNRLRSIALLKSLQSAKFPIKEAGLSYIIGTQKYLFVDIDIDESDIVKLKKSDNIFKRVQRKNNKLLINKKVILNVKKFIYESCEFEGTSDLSLFYGNVAAGKISIKFTSNFNSCFLDLSEYSNGYLLGKFSCNSNNFIAKYPVSLPF